MGVLSRWQGRMVGEDGWGGRQREKVKWYRSSALRKVRSSKTSEFRCIQPDGPARNSPLQEAKHVPFSGTSARKSYRIDRSLRPSNFPPKSLRYHFTFSLWLVFPQFMFLFFANSRGYLCC